MAHVEVGVGEAVGGGDSGEGEGGSVPHEHTARNSARKALQKFGSILERAGSKKDGLMGL